MRSRPLVVAHATRTGVSALNVVTAALDVDPRTEGTEIRFAKDVDGVVAAVEEATRTGRRAIVAWSFYSTDFAAATADLATVHGRTGRAAALHVAGGVHATAEPRATVEAGFDLACIGEGEETFCDLVHRVATGEDPRGFPGLAYVDEGGRFVTHGPGPRHPLDRYPGVNFRHRRWNPLEITRGCVYACSFCQTPFAFKARFRHRSVGDVRAHCEAMARSGATFMRFVTPTALSYGSEDTSVDLAAVEALLRAVREALGPAAKVFFGTFPSECRPEHVTDESLALIRRYCDNDSIIIGGQSGSERVLEATRRGHGVDDVVRAVARCIAAGLRPDVDFLYGLPGETEEDQRATVALAERLVAMGARIHSHGFMPLPGTPLGDAEPVPIGGDLAAMLGRLEARGRSYGPWRAHLLKAGELVRARRPR